MFTNKYTLNRWRCLLQRVCYYYYPTDTSQQSTERRSKLCTIDNLQESTERWSKLYTIDTLQESTERRSKCTAIDTSPRDSCLPPLSGMCGRERARLPRVWRVYAAAAACAILCHVNSLDGDLVHDDIPAVRHNRDVLGTAPLHHLLLDDFWGTPMGDAHSHKSYRPLTTLTFR